MKKRAFKNQTKIYNEILPKDHYELFLFSIMRVVHIRLRRDVILNYSKTTK